MGGPGLRERKKERTRRHIADTAARLFAERSYEQVAVTDVARAAEVAEQTVYNYFPTKEHLVTDREGQIKYRLCELIRSRPPGITPGRCHPRLRPHLRRRYPRHPAGALAGRTRLPGGH
jgi:AcrR family transcriptional regulator